MKTDNFRPMTSAEYRRYVAKIGLTLEDISRLFNLGRRTITRHANDVGDEQQRIGGPTTILLRALGKGKLTVKQVRKLASSS